MKKIKNILLMLILFYTLTLNINNSYATSIDVYNCETLPTNYLNYWLYGDYGGTLFAQYSGNYGGGVYCNSIGYRYYSVVINPPHVLMYNNYIVQPTVITYNSYSYSKSDYSDVTMVGNKNISGGGQGVVFSATDPYIYFENIKDTIINLSLKSYLDIFVTIPEFSKEIKNGWKIIFDKDGLININGKNTDNLFYELNINKVTLNRNGKNFKTKEELINFLENSDLFKKLGFDEKEKNNSLNYLLPKLKESKKYNNYYLTILDEKSVEEISSLNITEKEKIDLIVRKFYAIYPSNTEVTTTGDLIYPKLNIIKDQKTLKEYGEVLIDPSSMFVNFK